METIYTVTQSEIFLDSISKKIKLWFFGDVHRDTPSCDVDRWRWFLKRARDTLDDNTLFYAAGDYNDFASATEQKTIYRGNLHRETLIKLDGIVERDNRRFVNEISFMRGHMIGFIEGNHTWFFLNGKTATEDIAERMNTQYLGWLNHHTLSIKFRNTTKYINIHIVGCHGRAGGKKVGTSINQVEDMREIFPIADIFIMGHDHQRSATPQSVIVPTTSKKDGKIRMKQMRQFLCRSGSFKKGYTEGVSSYEVGRLLKPADLGALLLEISFHRDIKDEHDRLIVDIEARI